MMPLSETNRSLLVTEVAHDLLQKLAVDERMYWSYESVFWHAALAHTAGARA